MQQDFLVCYKNEKSCCKNEIATRNCNKFKEKKKLKYWTEKPCGEEDLVFGDFFVVDVRYQESNRARLVFVAIPIFVAIFFRIFFQNFDELKIF